MRVELTPWQREALRILATSPDGFSPAAPSIRTGCRGLVRRGLAETVDDGMMRYQITEAGHAEFLRRRGLAA